MGTDWASKSQVLIKSVQVGNPSTILLISKAHGKLTQDFQMFAISQRMELGCSDWTQCLNLSNCFRITPILLNLL